MPSVNHRARVTGEEIVDKTILEIDIGPAAVGFTELTAGLQGSLGVMPDTIGTTQLKEPGVGSQNIYNGAVYGTKIANDAIGSRHIQGTAISYENQVKINILGYGRLTAGLQGSLGGMPDTIGTTQLKEPGVGSENIYSNAVYGAKIAANAVGYGKLTTGLQGSLGGMPDTIGTTQLKEPGVGSQNIYSQAVYGAKIKNNAIGSQQLDSPGRGPYPGIQEYKFADHYERGTISGVRSAGRYKDFAEWFGDVPQVFVTAVGTYHACLDHAATRGSFKTRVFTNAGISGTANVNFMAWGPRP